MTQAACLKFLREFMAKPVQVGAIAPSSRSLARRMISGFDLENAEAVIELGPGTGSITAEIVDAIGSETRLIAIERNEDFARHLSERFPRIEVIAGCAQETHRFLDDLGLS